MATPPFQEPGAAMSPAMDAALKALGPITDQLIAAACIAPQLSARERSALAVLLAAKMFGAACASVQEAAGLASETPDHEIARQIADFIVGELRQRQMN